MEKLDKKFFVTIRDNRYYDVGTKRAEILKFLKNTEKESKLVSFINLVFSDIFTFIIMMFAMLLMSIMLETIIVSSMLNEDKYMVVIITGLCACVGMYIIIKYIRDLAKINKTNVGDFTVKEIKNFSNKYLSYMYEKYVDCYTPQSEIYDEKFYDKLEQIYNALPNKTIPIVSREYKYAYMYKGLVYIIGAKTKELSELVNDKNFDFDYYYNNNNNNKDKDEDNNKDKDEDGSYYRITDEQYNYITSNKLSFAEIQDYFNFENKFILKEL